MGFMMRVGRLVFIGELPTPSPYPTDIVKMYILIIDGMNRFMGAMTNNGRTLANFAGFYKGIQSAGAAIIWSLDSSGVEYMDLFVSTWVLLVGSLLVAAPVMFWKIRDSSGELDRDGRFTNGAEKRNGGRGEGEEFEMVERRG
jgi:hypothetical protein